MVAVDELAAPLAGSDSAHPSSSDGPPDPLERRLAELEQDVDSARLIRDSWTFIVLAVAAFAIILSLVAIGMAERALDSVDPHAGAAMSAAAVLRVRRNGT